MGPTLDNIGRLLVHDPKAPLLFNSGTFFLCFSLPMLGYALLLDKRRARIIYLYAFSLFYYYRCNGVFMLALCATTVVDFGLSHRLARETRDGSRKAIVALSVGLNLSILGYFKYTNFFLENVASVRGLVHEPLAIFLPIGISFYTFQSLSHVVDVYRRRLEPTRSLLDYAFYLSFFPQIVAGPIVRAQDFFPQLEHDAPKVSRESMGRDFFLILRGLAKKALIADYIGVFCDLIFAGPAAYHPFEVGLAIYAYALQIYFDFSGYSDIAIGMAGMTGIRLPDNFNAPYRATNVTEFWKRWHISLSTWLRDYLYIPLGGSRGSVWLRDRNLMITMLLGGLWHGASWNFVIWGAMHGVLLVAHKRLVLFRASRASGPGASSRGYTMVCWLLTFHFVLATWIFFRAPDFATAKAVILQLGSVDAERVAQLGTAISARRDIILAVAMGFAACALPARLNLQLGDRFARLPVLGKAFALLLLMQGVVQLSLTDIQPFIYFQF